MVVTLITVAERNDFIYEYYKNLYVQDPNEDDDISGCIERFLGPDILNSNLVANSKISETEKNSLEQEISLAELDKSVNEAKLNSVGGMDGIGNQFLKKFWVYFRIPLYNYAKCCFEKGQLTSSFKSAAIRLIPKKGDCSNIKNWRPISLLNCTYKILSRVINNRLKKVTKKILSRAQKGFTNHRNIQECLINIIENVAFAKKHNINGALVAIDQSKAFDSVSNKYMHEVYKFYGFGDNFINMLEVLGNNRQACVILEDSSYTKNFMLGKGRPQGDPPSPIQYNLAEQILLFKIELSPLIRPLITAQDSPALRLQRRTAPEAARATSTADAFADDTSVCTLLDYNDLNELKQILSDFGSN
jgi:hypothetical protein